MAAIFTTVSYQISDKVMELRMNQTNKPLASNVNCGVCGQPLVYATETKEQTCSLCGKRQAAQICCPQGHYICDTCHSKSALEALREILRTTKSADPSEILEEVLEQPAVPMHGPEHHAIVPAVLITAIKNAGYSLPEGALERAIERGSKVPGGWCGLYGDCGAGVGVGVATSVLTNATPLTGKQRSLSIAATAAALSQMVDDQPRCCKRASRTAVRVAVEYFRKNLNIDLPVPGKVKCGYVSRNQQCPHKECRYY
jgi:hypothetical protein